MDHKTKGWKIAGSSRQRQIIANLIKSLIEDGKVDTTLTRAKEARRHADRLVTLAKRENGQARRQAFKLINDKRLVTKLFEDIAGDYQDREGGYTRVLKLPPRRGDGADMARLTFV